MTDRRVGKAKLLEWAEAVTSVRVERWEDLRSGVVLGTLMQKVFPATRTHAHIPLSSDSPPLARRSRSSRGCAGWA